MVLPVFAREQLRSPGATVARLDTILPLSYLCLFPPTTPPIYQILLTTLSIFQRVRQITNVVGNAEMVSGNGPFNNYDPGVGELAAGIH